MQRWWLLYPDITSLFYLHDSTVFHSTLLFGASGQLKSSRGALVPWAPRMMVLYIFLPWTFIHMLGPNWCINEPFFVLGLGPWVLYCVWILHSHNSPLKFHSYIFHGKWSFDRTLMVSHALGVFPHESVFLFSLHTSWCFGIRNIAINAKYDTMSPTFYSAMKIQGLWILVGFQAGVFIAHFSPIYKGDRGWGGGGDHFSYFTNLSRPSEK